MLVGSNRLDHEGRKTRLKSVLGSDNIEVLGYCKRELLRNFIKVAGCPQLSSLLRYIQLAIRSIYDCFDEFTYIDSLLREVRFNFCLSSNRYDLETDVENAHLVARSRAHLDLIINRREETITSYTHTEHTPADADIDSMIEHLQRAEFDLEKVSFLDHALFRSRLVKALEAQECAAWIGEDD